jgi:hypothetical protein
MKIKSAFAGIVAGAVAGNILLRRAHLTSNPCRNSDPVQNA